MNDYKPYFTAQPGMMPMAGGFGMMGPAAGAPAGPAMGPSAGAAPPMRPMVPPMGSLTARSANLVGGMDPYTMMYMTNMAYMNPMMRPQYGMGMGMGMMPGPSGQPNARPANPGARPSGSMPFNY